MFATAAVVVLVAAAGAACRADPSTARGTAERFLDAHYVEIDLPAALPWTSGLARRKVEEEIALTQGVEIDEATQKPIVRYAFVEEHTDADGGTKFLYLGKIAVAGEDGFERRWLVTVRHEVDGFRVTNYQELAE
jgi:hypothetical protein